MKKIAQLVLGSSLAVLGATSANAAVDAAVTTAISTAGTDSAAVAGAVFVVIVGIFAYKMLRKAL